MLLQAAASWLLGIAGATGVAVTAATTPRQRVSLDGEWNFSLHAPAAAGALLGPVQTGTILVPGSWEAQGFGTQTVQMHHQVLTGDNARGQRGAVGVYTQSLKLPAPCPAAHRPVFMVDQVRTRNVCRSRHCYDYLRGLAAIMKCVTAVCMNGMISSCRPGHPSPRDFQGGQPGAGRAHRLPHTLRGSAHCGNGRGVLLWLRVHSGGHPRRGACL
jgi:hypothetical protein